MAVLSIQIKEVSAFRPPFSASVSPFTPNLTGGHIIDGRVDKITTSILTTKITMSSSNANGCSSDCDQTNIMLIPKLYSTIEEVENDLRRLHDPEDNSQPTSFATEKSINFENPDNNDKNNYQSPHLFLHFDVNETLLIGDPAGGDTVHECLNKIIAKSAFVSTAGFSSDDNGDENDNDASLKRSPSSGNISGMSTHHYQPTHWWNGLPLDALSTSTINAADAATNNVISTTNENNESSPNQSNNIKEGATPPQPPPLYTGWTYPTNTCPYYRTNYKKIAKQFTELEHGRMYRPLYQHLCRKMGLDYDPPTTPPLATTKHVDEKEILTTLKCDGGDSSTIKGSLFDCYIPAFFHTLQYYFPSSSASSNGNESSTALPMKNTLPPPERVTLILRTFGHDLPRVAKAISEFAKGNHPLFPKYNNKDLILEQSDLYCGGWSYRNNVVDVTASTASENIDNEEELIYELHPYYSKHDADNANSDNGSGSNSSNNKNDDAADHSGDDAVLNFLQSKTIAGIQDHYPFWRQNNHAPWAGKPVWANVNTNTSRHHHHHHILLDDNIHNDPNDGAGGIRIPITANDNSNTDEALAVAHYESLHGKEALSMHGMHLIRVPTIRPLLEENWFIRQIEDARWRLFLKEVEMGK